MKNARYVGDEISNSDENIKYVNDLAQIINFQKNLQRAWFLKQILFRRPTRTTEKLPRGIMTANIKIMFGISDFMKLTADGNF